MDYVKKIYEILDMIEITDENKEQIIEIQELLENGQYEAALGILKRMKFKTKENVEEKIKKFEKNDEKRKEDEEPSLYPEELSNQSLEETFIGLLLDNLVGVLSIIVPRKLSTDKIFFPISSNNSFMPVLSKELVILNKASILDA